MTHENSISSPSTISRERFSERDQTVRDFYDEFHSKTQIDPDLADRFFNSVWQIGFRVARRMGFEGETCNDIAATTVLDFFEAIKNRNFVPMEGVPVTAYISRAGRFTGFYNIRRDEVRTKHEIHDPLDILADHEGMKKFRPTEDIVMNKLLVEEISSFINEHLSPPQKQVMNLLGDGFTHEEICTTLKISDAQLRNLIYRARKTLNNWIKE